MITKKLIENAWWLSGVKSQGDQLSAEEVNDGLLYLNLTIDELDIQGLMTFATQVLDIPLTAGVVKYTIGLTGDVVAQRPNKINNGYLKQSTSLDMNMVQITSRQYDQIGLKTSVSSIPTVFFYNPTYENGELYIWPKPSQDYTMKIRFNTYIQQSDNINEDISYPPGYEKMLIYILASELSNYKNGFERPDLIDKADKLKYLILKNNEIFNDMNIDPRVLAGGGSGSYNDRIGFLSGFVG